MQVVHNLIGSDTVIGKLGDDTQDEAAYSITPRVMAFAA